MPSSSLSEGLVGMGTGAKVMNERLVGRKKEEPVSEFARDTRRVAFNRRRRREGQRGDSQGEALGEPMLTALDVAAQVDLAASISTALLVILETLSPPERVVFVLREAFALSHAEIARKLGRSEPRVRQLARTSRTHVSERRPQFEPDAEVRREVTDRFLAAVMDGDLAGLMAVLTPDVTLITDARGTTCARRRPVVGAEKVACLCLAMAERPSPDHLAVVGQLGGPLSLVANTADVSIAAATLTVEDGLVRYIYLAANAWKRRRLKGLD
jgi:RNA polymerase sigma-70 factor, ECF subfamily